MESIKPTLVRFCSSLVKESVLGIHSVQGCNISLLLWYHYHSWEKLMLKNGLMGGRVCH